MAKNILKYDDLVKMSNAMIEMGYFDSNITILIKVGTQKMLDRINDDFFFKSGKPQSEKLTNVSDVTININGVTFKYVVEDD